MRHLFYRRRFIFIPFAVAAFLALTGFVVMNLWNYLLPGILHVGVITFWQALGIFVLCKILFGFGRGGHRCGGGPPWRRKWAERFNNMSPEEKQKFKEKWDQKCGWGNRHWDTRHPFDTGWENPPAAEKASE